MIEFTYEPETGHVFKNGRRVGWDHSTGYRYVQVGNKAQKEHRLVWFLHFGAWPSKQIDHINGNRSDNRIANLREAEPSENQGNKVIRRDSATGIKGVSFQRGRYRASIRDENGRRKFLGSFATKDLASQAYEAAAIDRFGEFARFK